MSAMLEANNLVFDTEKKFLDSDLLIFLSTLFLNSHRLWAKFGW
jgi:hypothetical protein